MKKKMNSYYLIIWAFVLMMTGCIQNGEKEESKLVLLKKTDPSTVTISNKNSSKTAQKIKKDISSFREIYDVAVIKGKKNTLVAYKVKHLQRFRMKAIEEKMNKLLEKKYPDEEFTVSSDYKIFLEAIKLKEEVEEKNLSEKKAENRLRKIINLNDETT